MRGMEAHSCFNPRVRIWVQPEQVAGFSPQSKQCGSKVAEGLVKYDMKNTNQTEICLRFSGE
jgi:hypothetical protein